MVAASGGGGGGDDDDDDSDDSDAASIPDSPANVNPNSDDVPRALIDDLVLGNNNKFHLKNQHEHIQCLIKGAFNPAWWKLLEHNALPDALERVPITRQVLIDVAERLGDVDMVERLKHDSPSNHRFCTILAKMVRSLLLNSIPGFCEELILCFLYHRSMLVAAPAAPI